MSGTVKPASRSDTTPSGEMPRARLPINIPFRFVMEVVFRGVALFDRALEKVSSAYHRRLSVVIMEREKGNGVRVEDLLREGYGVSAAVNKVFQKMRGK